MPTFTVKLIVAVFAVSWAGLLFADDGRSNDAVPPDGSAQENADQLAPNEAAPSSSDGEAPAGLEKTAVPAYEGLLSSRDIALYREIFELQRDGEWREADALIEQVGNDILMGHVLFQRYMHPTAYRSKFSELKNWMDRYADHPGAYRIYRLALRRKPSGAARPDEPVPLDPEEPESLPVAADDRPMSEAEKQLEMQKKEARRVRSKIRYYLNRGQPERAEKRLWASERPDFFAKAEFDEQLERVAAGYFFTGDDDKAYTLAKLATRSREQVVMPDWVAGLASWRLGDYESSASHFESLAEARNTSDWVTSAGAFWAARAHRALDRPQRAAPLLESAAEKNRTFYGLIAARQLGKITELHWSSPSLNKDAYERLLENEAIRRAIALHEIGHHDMADQEMRYAWRRSGKAGSEDVLALAASLNLPATQLYVSRHIEDTSGVPYIKALYPVPDWQPAGGFSLDRAMVYAFIRQESAFNASAISHAGARGLMQIMPATASFIARDRSLYRSNRAKLYEPDFNLSLGQRYIHHLLEMDQTEKNLFLVAAAYNGGPGNLSRWLQHTKHNRDWLLFIESIPLLETRNYVERVMANLWIYRMRLGQPTPTLNAVAAGEWPIYTPLDSPLTVPAEAVLRTH